MNFAYFFSYPSSVAFLFAYESFTPPAPSLYVCVDLDVSVIFMCC